ncbi:undecaprenyl/decaprenyl-phosphate alpha-N-acetylglucosaminyl 1-phosphate transferase [Candidatus Sumerlaeota bacterium]|nr:undecaprenyl/decaprenyl-phosphate alpha-N-acetylglucosaminyl 1-phosphate transferase [Candidatus Sumerlaeota bacterium]
MMQLLTWPVCLAILFFEAVGLSLLLTPVAQRLGQRGFLDAPGERKIHEAPIPRNGGMAIVAAFLIVLLGNIAAAWLFRDALIERVPHAANLGQKWKELTAVLAGGVWIFGVGLLDDRRALRPLVKFAGQLLAAAPLLIAGIQLKSFLPDAAGMALTVFWVALLCNSLNFLDNMNGLSSGVGVICALIFGWIAYDSGQFFMAAMFLILAGSYAGFWHFNFNKGDIFMGDGGSMFLGYMLAALSILTNYWEAGAPSGLPVLMPVVVLGVPLFDTLSVFWIRFRSGQPLYKGDMNHFSHRLVDLGLSRRGAVMFIYLVTACVGLSALPFKALSLAQALVYSLQIVIWFCIIYWIERLGKKKAE